MTCQIKAFKPAVNKSPAVGDRSYELMWSKVPGKKTSDNHSVRGWRLCISRLFEEINIKSCCDRFFFPRGVRIRKIFSLYGIKTAKFHCQISTAGKCAQTLWQMTVCSLCVLLMMYCSLCSM